MIKQTQDHFSQEIHGAMNVTGESVERIKNCDMEFDHWWKVLNLNATLFFSQQSNRSFHEKEQRNSLESLSSWTRGGWTRSRRLCSVQERYDGKGAGLAKELEPDIRANTLCPGMIDTDFHNNITRSEVRKAAASATLLERDGESEQVAEVAKLAYSMNISESSFMTGSCLDINGGILFS